MESGVVQVEGNDWQAIQCTDTQRAALEAGKVLFFPHLGFTLQPEERSLLRPDVRDAGARNISLNVDGSLKGAAGDATTRALLTGMIGRYRTQALALIHGLLPHYTPALRLAPTSYRPHVDAFPTRPNRGERILRVFANIHPEGVPRVWRVGASFETIARQFLPKAKPYSAWQAKALQLLHVTKSFRSEYDHLMLQLHDGMKRDLAWQQSCPQETVPFPAGSVWICFSDQATHAVMSGQYMMEQTLHLPADHAYNKEASPLAILTRLMGRTLV